MTPRQAFFSDAESVDLQDAAGRIAADSVIPYPPGIPVLCPGERISGEVLDFIGLCRKNGVPLHGLADPKGESIRVVRGSCRGMR